MFLAQKCPPHGRVGLNPDVFQLFFILSYSGNVIFLAHILGSSLRKTAYSFILFKWRDPGLVYTLEYQLHITHRFTLRINIGIFFIEMTSNRFVLKTKIKKMILV